MLCKNCGKELPIAGKFCPFCGAAVEQTGVNDVCTLLCMAPADFIRCRIYLVGRDDPIPSYVNGSKS